MKFKPGEKVRRVDESEWPEEFGYKDEVFIVRWSSNHLVSMIGWPLDRTAPVVCYERVKEKAMKYEVAKWYPWTGGECPVHPKTLVVCKFDDGAENLPEEAGKWVWHGRDIVAFKVVEEYEEPREWWLLVSSLSTFAPSVFETQEEAKMYKMGNDKIIKVREVKE